jgi:hypothetical protein
MCHQPPSKTVVDKISESMPDADGLAEATLQYFPLARHAFGEKRGAKAHNLARSADNNVHFALTFSHFIIKQLRSTSCNS